LREITRHWAPDTVKKSLSSDTPAELWLDLL